MHDATALADAIARHAPHDGMLPTAIPGLTLIRTSAPTLPMPVVYEPSVCLVAQGRKRALLGTTAFDYMPGTHLLASVGLPIVGSVTEASPQRPYLSLQLEIDVHELGELALRHVPTAEAPAAPTGLTLGTTPRELLDASVRLVSLLDAPDDIDALAPLTVREMLYRLLSGPEGHILRHMARADSRLSQVARAIVWIRQRYREACRIEEAADVAAMSRSSFHQHFRAITRMSPIEFRTQLRLQEARRLMLAEAMDAASAGFAVGYGSPSQFSRDYARVFGSPPARDAQRLRLEFSSA
ncbi:AraC family transcriptional regulator [Coralloluteibacterium stylophorae]|uniref:AraC family transcriptional regulator n=1 Tax=Coralloluteibacterium stylophorae TaxID=1776034 RepID=A0A8J8AWD4_9GAMM|nr:AraC family transcriptional regulator [Coralloluteibacterium stylophorae]MBS7457281.1 AraC family transcriptional regulator [Coralloluteibacterium stylophorae]